MELKEKLTSLVGKTFIDENDYQFKLENFHINGEKTVIVTDGKFFDIAKRETESWIDSLTEIEPKRSFVPDVAAMKKNSEEARMPAPELQVNASIFGDIAAVMKQQIQKVKDGEKLDSQQVKDINSLVNTTMNVAKTEIELRRLMMEN